jgi:hypothetical protein
MSRKILSIVLAVLLLFTASVVANAESVEIDVIENTSSEETVQPRYDYTSSTWVNLVISNNKASCTSRLIGYQSTTKIVITMTLQKKTLFWWSEVETWTGTYNDFVGELSKSKSIESGTYRIKTKFVVYSGSDSETITVKSPEREC